MAERPIECSECKKNIQVTYKEIARGKSSCTEMCGTCPILEKKLHGKPDFCASEKNKEREPKLCCAICMTTTEAIETGNPLGCSHCYIVFEEVLLKKLISENALPLNLQKSEPLHRGKSPNQSITIPLSNQLAAFNEALNIALQKEHYEQAAWLRDQIQSLKDKASERKKQSS